MDYKKYIAEKINVEGVSKEEIYDSIALPPNLDMGDYALPCFKFAKVLRKSPVMIAESLKNEIATDDVISEVSAVNGYLNFKINKDGFVRHSSNRVARAIYYWYKKEQKQYKAQKHNHKELVPTRAK